MSELIIVGAGIAGSATARIAKDLGISYTLIDADQNRAASQAALATIRPTWFDNDKRPSIERSWKWYEQWGAAITQEAYVSSWRNPEPKKQKDWWLLDPRLCFEAPMVQARVTKIEDTTVTLETGEILKAEAVLNCVGALDSNLQSNFQPLLGATLISDNATVDLPPLRVHQIRPFHVLTVGQLNGQVRLGSSIGKTVEQAIGELSKMLTIAIQQGIIAGDATWQTIIGIRARRKGNEPILPQPGQRSATMGALARSGYAIAPDAAHNWLLSL